MNKKPLAALLVAALVPVAWAQAPAHKMIMAKDLKWDDVPSLPPGAKATVIEGPMNEAVPFTMRLKFPANYRIPPHWHPAVERVTVISGSFHMATGEKFDEKALHKLAPGDMMVMQPKTPHFAMAKEAAVVQLHGSGPWSVTYINPDDDPRKKKDAAKKDDGKKK